MKDSPVSVLPVKKVNKAQEDLDCHLRGLLCHMAPASRLHLSTGGPLRINGTVL